MSLERRRRRRRHKKAAGHDQARRVSASILSSCRAISCQELASKALLDTRYGPSYLPLRLLPERLHLPRCPRWLPPAGPPKLTAEAGAGATGCLHCSMAG